jgi:hypothetical protein
MRKLIIYMMVTAFTLPAHAQGGIVNWYRQTSKYVADTATVFDADAQRFIDSAGITDATQKAAINRLVLDLKGAQNFNYYTTNIWSKFLWIYPFVGGTASSCKWNLKNPVNADTAYVLTFVGSPTISANGVKWVTGSYADTKYVWRRDLGTNPDYHYCVYTGDEGAGDWDMGVLNAIVNSANADLIQFGTKTDVTGGMLCDTYAAPTFAANSRLIANAPKRACWAMASRTSASSYKMYRNGNIVASSLTASQTYLTTTNTTATLTLWLGGRHFSDGTLSAQSFRLMEFASGGHGLTDAEALAYYNAVQNFQAALGRAVN